MSSLADAARFLASVFARAADAWSDPALTRALFRDLGWELASLPPDIAAVGGALAAVDTLWRDLEHADPSEAQVAQIASAIGALWHAFQTLETTPAPSGLPAAFAEGLATTLLDYWVIDALHHLGDLTLPALELLGIVEIRYVEEALPRQRYFLRRVHWELLPKLLADPGAAFRARWGWGTAAFDAPAMLARFRDLIAALPWPASLRTAPHDEMLAAGDATTEDALCADVELLAGEVAGTKVAAGVRLLPIAPPGGSPGLALVPYLDGALGDTIAINDRVSLTIDASFDLEGGVAVTWIPERGVEVKLGLGAAAVTGASGRGSFTLDVHDPTRTPRALFDALGVRLTAATVIGLAQIELGSSSSFSVEISLADGVLTWDPSQAPGVLARVLGDHQVTTAAPLGLGWSSTAGFYVRGGSALGAAIPATWQLGPLAITGLRVAVAGVPSGIALSLGVDGRVGLGPVTIAWQGLGATLALSKPATGSLPLALDVDANAPSAISISVASPLVSGSGSIQRQDADHYAGALALTAYGLGIAGEAVVAKQQSAYSIAAVATATWPGIPLGLGFELDGMTALFGLRRSVDADAGRAMLRTGGISSLLAATDPLRALDALAKLLPITEGRDVIGLGPSIGWGSPRVLQAELAVVLELPSPIRIVLLAAAQLGLPTLDKRIVDLRLDAIGVLDLDRSTLAIDASLHDSKVAGYALAGDMALRMGWGANPQLLLAIGGFHPHFTPPPGFPSLQRLQLTAGDNPQLQLQAYLALTSNTAQVGAHAALSYKGGGFTIGAQAGFDALFQFSPFQFDVDISASAAISWHGHNLASISLDAELTGPHPWHAVGSASFGILWWSVSVGFDATWGDATPEPLPAAPDVAALVRDALQHPSSWQSQLDNHPGWLVLASTTTPRLHPLGTLMARERVAPLGLPITEYGDVPLPAPLELSIASVTIGHTVAHGDPVTDAFAIGQFTQMPADARLAAPSFERFTSGIALGATAVTTGAVARASLEAETIEIDPLAPPPRPPTPAPVRAILATALAAARGRVAPPARTGPSLSDIAYVRASTATLAASGTATTFASAAASLGPGLQIVAAAHAAS